MVTIYSLDILLSQFGTSSMSGSNCCILTCIQISQEAGKVVCYSHHLKNFPVCYYPHSQRLLYCVHLCMKYSLGISSFLEEISSVLLSIVFFYFFVFFTLEVFLMYPCYSLEPRIQMGISFLFSIAFHFSSFLSYL